MESLQAKIMEVLGSISRDNLAKACRRSRQKINATVQAVSVFFNAMHDIN